MCKKSVLKLTYSTWNTEIYLQRFISITIKPKNYTLKSVPNKELHYKFFHKIFTMAEQFYLKKNYEQMPLISNFKWFFTVFFVLLGISVVFSRKIYFTEERFLFKMFQILSARKLHGKSFMANFIFCAVIETSKY